MDSPNAIVPVREIARKYDDFARFYDLAELVPELLGLKRLRKRLIERAAGDVLETAIGTGKNLAYYSSECHVSAVDVSGAMLSKAKARADRLGLDVRCEVMDAEQLVFADESFDTIVDTLSLCTFPDPIATLRELGRVCRSSGKLLLLEHGRSDTGWLAAFQDRRAVSHAKPLGCHWNREPLALVEQSGLRIVHAERHFFGIFHLIHAVPAHS